MPSRCGRTWLQKIRAIQGGISRWRHTKFTKQCVKMSRSSKWKLSEMFGLLFHVQLYNELWFRDWIPADTWQNISAKTNSFMRMTTTDWISKHKRLKTLQENHNSSQNNDLIPLQASQRQYVTCYVSSCSRCSVSIKTSLRKRAELFLVCACLSVCPFQNLAELQPAAVEENITFTLFSFNVLK